VKTVTKPSSLKIRRSRMAVAYAPEADVSHWRQKSLPSINWPNDCLYTYAVPKQLGRAPNSLSCRCYLRREKSIYRARDLFRRRVATESSAGTAFLDAYRSLGTAHRPPSNAEVARLLYRVADDKTLRHRRQYYEVCGMNNWGAHRREIFVIQSWSRRCRRISSGLPPNIFHRSGEGFQLPIFRDFR